MDGDFNISRDSRLILIHAWPSVYDVFINSKRGDPDSCGATLVVKSMDTNPSSLAEYSGTKKKESFFFHYNLIT